MAKSARASSRKAAKTRLRNNVHAPVEEARLQRLSTRLLALASSSQPSTSTRKSSDEMEIEHEADSTMNDRDDSENVQDSNPRSKSTTSVIRTKKVRKSKSSKSVLFPRAGKKAKAKGGIIKSRSTKTKS